MLKRLNWKVIRVALFVILFVAIFARASNILVNSGMYNYQMVGTFPEEPSGTLDAVYVGGSNSFTFFQGPIAWEKYGMTVRMFSSDGQPMACREGFVRYAQKTHPSSLYIITIQLYGTELSKQSLHWAVDFFPESVEKYQMIHELTNLSKYPFDEVLAIYLPFLQYHSRWNSLTYFDFHHESNGMKGAFSSSTFLNVVEDISESYYSSGDKKDLSEETCNYYDDMLDYFDEVNLNALFVIPPNCQGENGVAEINSIQSLIEQRGYPVLNLIPMTKKLGMDFKTDYYNGGHTNVHGSLKVTDYIADYLHENYSFEDKRGNPDYASWDVAYDKYKETIAPYL